MVFELLGMATITIVLGLLALHGIWRTDTLTTYGNSAVNVRESVPGPEVPGSSLPPHETWFTLTRQSEEHKAGGSVETVRIAAA